MMPYDEALAYMQRMAVDKSTDTLTFLKTMYGVAYTTILTQFGRPPIEVVRTTALVANQRGYQMPVDCGKPVEIEIQDGTRAWPLVESANSKQWTMAKSGGIIGSPRAFHFRPRFGIGGGILELDPIPSSNYTMLMTYEAIEKAPSNLKYTDGTITLATDSTTVTGVGTAFTQAMIGRYVIPTGEGQEGLPYRIVGSGSPTNLVLENSYAGAGGSTLIYKIVEIPNLPYEMQILPAYWSLWQYYSGRGNADKTKEFFTYFDIGMRQAKENHAMSVRDGTVDMGYSMGGGGSSIFDAYPINFPQSVL
jgi:hypothetical protein